MEISDIIANGVAVLALVVASLTSVYSLNPKPKIKMSLVPKFIPSYTNIASSSDSCSLRFAIPILIENSGNIMTTLKSGQIEILDLKTGKKLSSQSNLHISKPPLSIQAGQAVYKPLSFRVEVDNMTLDEIRKSDFIIKVSLAFLKLNKEISLKHRGFSYVGEFNKNIDFGV